jgi:outer membrane protein assembly factor BamB
MARRLGIAALGAFATVTASLAGEPLAPEARPAGFRGDWRGVFPDATPVTEWSATKNIIWAADMPGWTDATPVVSGDRIFVMAEPSFLICVAKADGRELWRRENNAEKLSPAADLAALREAAERRAPIEAKLGPLKGEKKDVDGQLKGSPQDENLKRRAKELGDEISRLEAELRSLPKPSSIKTHKDVGFTCCTPVTDGMTVFALFHSGLGVAYDREGRLQWARLVRTVNMGYGQSMSPALAGSVLGVHIDEEMFGLDLATGRTLWKGEEVQHQGSPVGVKVGDLHVIVSTHGTVRRASDGEVLARLGFPALMKFNTPVVIGSTIWFLGEDKFLVRVELAPKGKDSVEIRRSNIGVPSGIYYASALVHDNLAYLWDKSNALRVIDLSTKKLLLEKNLKLGGTAYPSPAAAGKYIFVASDGGTVAVLEPVWTTIEGAGKAFELREIARNTIELEGGKRDALRACPVFEGKRMYLRCFRRLYCIGS